MNLVLFLGLLIGCCGYALARGGAPERAAAVLQLGAFAIDETVHRLVDGRSYTSVTVGSAVIDLTLFVALAVLAHRSTRFWPLWLAGFQLAAIAAHAAKAIDPRMAAAGYAFQTQLWAYPMLLAMAAGTWRHQARLAAGDPDPSWKVLPG